ncbi:UbiA family prenyltransferase [Acidiplasma cupricumulans]|jgi:geranylgeranylglycerol-phosphate geranylgeranyltransferase|uniref:Digeranylgeranylglyceryl phosphate synthase n=1 Tax=Acidiplasma cupricumulans TaxID=312540 RepID=A0A0Q0RY16_9ARCH|nr:UbiA family prenyltransferase [Acidiplasma cupricumulans]KQB34951.1 digeranylgeranylglyceryl phosphate synthase [Acidiplasma cupricumulans]
MNPWIRILRPVNALMGFFSIYIIGFIAVNVMFYKFLVPLTLGAISVFLVTGAGNIINDISDLNTDKINHPDRPLPSGKITRQSALIVSIIIFVIAIIVSSFISYKISLIVFIAEMLLVSYEFKTKKLGLTGNFTISLLIGMIFLFGGVITDSLLKMTLLFLLAFFSNFSREIMKDIEDIKGDQDRMTFPKKYGIRNAKILSTVFVGITVSISAVPYLIKILSVYYLYAVIIDDFIFIYSVVIMRKSVSEGQKVSKIAMIFGMFSFLLGGIN